MAQVLSVQLPDGSPFSPSPLRSSASHTSFFDASSPFASSTKTSYSHSDLRSGSLASSHTSSFRSTPSSGLSLDTRFDEDAQDEQDTSDDDDDDDYDDDALFFPAYRTRKPQPKPVNAQDPPSSPVNVARPPPSPVDGVGSAQVFPPEPLPVSEDDTAVRIEPSQHVDYLSYDWKEEEIWSSWRHITTQRKVYGERSRLENASWRTWAKSQFKLKTVSPETLNWLKDCDVTWLYGPLQPAPHTYTQHASEPVSQLSKSNSFINKKPILKKRSMSEVMLQKSLSASSLLKQAAAAVQAQQAYAAIPERRKHRPIIGRATSDFVTSSIPSPTASRDTTDCFSSRSTSGLQTPDHGEKKHIRFDDKVEQCIAVDVKDGEDDDDDDDDDDEYSDTWANEDSDGSSDDGVIMMKRSRKKRPLSRTNSKTSFGGESKTIAKLPSTTLKYRTDSPDVTEQQPTHSLGFWRSSRLSPSPSQETLRPSNPSTNFLLAEDDGEEAGEEEEDEDDIFSFNPSSAYGIKREDRPNPSNSTLTFPISPPSAEAESSEAGGLRRTASGMFMPYDEEVDNSVPPGLIGRVVDTVNTARDIAHVIWNVGWRNN